MREEIDINDMIDYPIEDDHYNEEAHELKACLSKNELILAVSFEDCCYG